LPVFASWIAARVGQERFLSWSESSLRTAQYVALAVGVGLFAATGLIESAFKMTRASIESRGKDLDVLILHCTLATAVCPSLGALLLFFVGGSRAAVWMWSMASLLLAGFWCVRYRRVLLSGHR
jgi:hypothetical protein